MSLTLPLANVSALKRARAIAPRVSGLAYCHSGVLRTATRGLSVDPLHSQVHGHHSLLQHLGLLFNTAAKAT
jgi:hypothetical protein